YEEFLFRGYVQFTLGLGIGFWPAAVLLSAGFGYVHLSNGGENWIGAASVATIGLLFAFTLRRSGNLWYAVGLHASFDWGETFLYSVPNSGEVLGTFVQRPTPRAEVVNRRVGGTGRKCFFLRDDGAAVFGGDVAVPEESDSEVRRDYFSR